METYQADAGNAEEREGGSFGDLIGIQCHSVVERDTRVINLKVAV